MVWSLYALFWYWLHRFESVFVRRIRFCFRKSLTEHPERSLSIVLIKDIWTASKFFIISRKSEKELTKSKTKHVISLWFSVITFLGAVACVLIGFGLFNFEKYVWNKGDKMFRYILLIFIICSLSISASAKPVITIRDFTIPRQGICRAKDRSYICFFGKRKWK